MTGRCTALGFALVLVAATVTASARQDEKSAELRRKLDMTLGRVAADLDGVMGYVILDLTSGERLERLPGAVFATASTIKLAILYELFKQADEGTMKLDEVRPLDRTLAVGGTGILAELSAPAMPLRDYATLMVVLSDNTATNLLIEAVGMRNVTARMASLGLRETKLRRRMIDAAAARRGDENVSTPAEIARLLAIIHRGEGLTAPSQQGLVAILKKEKSTAMRRGIPAAVEVANKPGTLEGIEVDAGIVYVPGRPYVFVAMTGLLKEGAAGEAAITAASRAAYDYFDRIAKSSEYGRVVR